MAIRICLRRVKPRRAALGLGFLALREGGGEARSSQKCCRTRQRHTSLRLPLLKKEGKTPFPPQQSGGSWCEKQPEDRQKWILHKHKRSFRAHCGTYSKTRCQGLASTERESNKRSASRVMHSKPRAQREGEALMNS